MQFGVSTHLYHGARLDRDHLVEIAAHGFEAVEIFATRTHFDYHDEQAVAGIEEHLARQRGCGRTRCTRRSTESLSRRRLGPGVLDRARRRGAAKARRSTKRVGRAARGRIDSAPAFVVLHPGMPTAQQPDATRQPARRVRAKRGGAARGRRAARRPAGARGDPEPDLGDAERWWTCSRTSSRPTGSASASTPGMRSCSATSSRPWRRSRGTWSRRTCTTTTGARRPPGAVRRRHRLGRRVLMALQKIGYEGTWMFELAGDRRHARVLETARSARGAGSNESVDVMTYIQDIAKHEGQTVTIQRLAAQPPLERQDSLPAGPRRQRLHPGGDVEGRRRRGRSSSRPITSRRRPRSSVTGTVRADARAPGGYEIDVTGLDVHHEAHDFPITPKEHGVDFLLDRRHLWIRSPRQQAILRVRHEVINAVRDYFNERDFILADTPIFTPAACEGTTTLFPVQYFEDTTAYLTQSGQLYNEANAMALGRVYCFGPDVPRREVEDAPPPHRVLDGRARRWRTPTLDDVIELAEGLVEHVVGACSTSAPARTEGARARHVEARDGEGAVPARLVRRGGEDPDREGPALPARHRSRRHRRDRALGPVRPAGRACIGIRRRSRRST